MAVSVKIAMMGVVTSGSASDKGGLRSDGYDVLNSGPELGHPDHAAPLELNHVKRTLAAVVGHVAADVVCRGLGLAEHAVVCPQRRCLVHGMEQLQGRESNDIAFASMVLYIAESGSDKYSVVSGLVVFPGVGNYDLALFCQWPGAEGAKLTNSSFTHLLSNYLIFFCLTSSFQPTSAKHPPDKPRPSRLIHKCGLILCSIHHLECTGLSSFPLKVTVFEFLPLRPRIASHRTISQPYFYSLLTQFTAEMPSSNYSSSPPPARPLVSHAAPTGMAPRRFSPASKSPPRFWNPPPDPEKPTCPYRAGFAVEIKRHTPPPPFGDPHYGPGTWPERNDVDLKSVTQTELVLAHPPLERQDTVSSSPAATATLTILETLAVADGRGAQLVVCSVIPSPCPQKPDGFVAKIFDPLYYPFECPHAAHEADDVSWVADVDYTHEAAALNHLEGMRKGGRTGLSTPKYYGAWTFILPITHAGKKVQRSVRLVLMEHIMGHSIRSVCLDPALFSRFTEVDRLDILAMVLDGSVRQRHAGVDQRDLASRNVILRPAPTSSPSGSNKQPLPPPVIVDYNGAVVFELSRNGKHPCQLAKLPQNPMRVFWNSGFPEFEGWIPHQWQDSHKLCQQWLKERFGGEAASQYAPVSNELEFSDY